MSVLTSPVAPSFAIPALGLGGVSLQTGAQGGHRLLSQRQRGSTELTPMFSIISPSPGTSRGPGYADAGCVARGRYEHTGILASYFAYDILAVSPLATTTSSNNLSSRSLSPLTTKHRSVEFSPVHHPPPPQRINPVLSAARRATDFLILNSRPRTFTLLTQPLPTKTPGKKKKKNPTADKRTGIKQCRLLYFGGRHRRCSFAPTRRRVVGATHRFSPGTNALTGRISLSQTNKTQQVTNHKRRRENKLRDTAVMLFRGRNFGRCRTAPPARCCETNNARCPNKIEQTCNA